MPETAAIWANTPCTWLSSSTCCNGLPGLTGFGFENVMLGVECTVFPTPIPGGDCWNAFMTLSILTLVSCYTTFNGHPKARYVCGLLSQPR
jgi:hypothetical protein